MKKFLVIGNMNAVTYKEIFPLIRENKLWTGISTNGSNRWFRVPNNYIHRNNAAGYKEQDGKKFIRINGIMWFSNLENNKSNEPLDLYKHYSPDEYPKYDNYDAIEVSKVCEIPMDYDGVMGVPITFLDKFCPEQFEIIGIDRYIENNPNYGHRINLNGKEVYARIIIKRIGSLK